MYPYSLLLGKVVKKLAALRGGGSALPGLFVEKIDPDFTKRTLERLPYGNIVISGTNGKTTTTKMVVELLESQGLKVFTNRTGSNFSRGVAAALLGEVDTRGHLDADIAVLELDEAHAVHFVRAIPPTYSLLLNVMRDQLDRFGEIDTTAKMLEQIALATREKVVINREDPRLVKIGANLPPEHTVYFGLGPKALKEFPTDDDMHRDTPQAGTSSRPQALSILENLNGQTGEFTLNGHKMVCDLKLEGIYNVYNAAAALGLVGSIVKEIDFDSLKKALSEVAPAFGRGEKLSVNGQPLELVLVKNPSGFRLGLKSFPPEGYSTMIAINDNYADGRDMSWLWDVDFDSLREGGVAMVSGMRAYDMALRLQYEEVEVTTVETDLKKSLHQFIAIDSRPKRIYCSYTAMLALRRELGKIVKVEVVK